MFKAPHELREACRAFARRPTPAGLIRVAAHAFACGIAPPLVTGVTTHVELDGDLCEVEAVTRVSPGLTIVTLSHATKSVRRGRRQVSVWDHVKRYGLPPSGGSEEFRV